MALENHYANLVEESERKYANALEEKMLENSYDAIDFYSLHNIEKQMAMKLVTTEIFREKRYPKCIVGKFVCFFKQFRDKVETSNNGINKSKTSAHELRLNERIDSKYKELEQRNEVKYANYSVSSRNCLNFVFLLK